MSAQAELLVRTTGRAAYDLTADVREHVRNAAVESGLVHVFIRHTSASLMLCENADPDVLRDLETFLSRLVPDGDPMFVHTAEGPDDMPAHIRSILTQPNLTIPIVGGRCALGTWQGVYLCEHRTAPHTREVVLTVQPV